MGLIVQRAPNSMPVDERQSLARELMQPGAQPPVELPAIVGGRNWRAGPVLANTTLTTIIPAPAAGLRHVVKTLVVSSFTSTENRVTFHVNGVPFAVVTVRPLETVHLDVAVVLHAGEPLTAVCTNASSVTAGAHYYEGFDAVPLLTSATANEVKRFTVSNLNAQAQTAFFSPTGDVFVDNILISNLSSSVTARFLLRVDGQHLWDSSGLPPGQTANLTNGFFMRNGSLTAEVVGAGASVAVSTYGRTA